MDSTLVSCHGIFQHKKQTLGAFAVYRVLEDGSWQREANFLVLRLQRVHLALASPFLLHRITHRDSELVEWSAAETDGRFFLDCVACRLPKDADDLLAFADAYVKKWTLYPMLARMASRSGDELLGRFTQDALKLPKLPACHFPRIPGALDEGWHVQLSLAYGDDMALPFFRLRAVPAIQALLLRTGQAGGLLDPTDEFLIALAAGENAQRLDALMWTSELAPPLSPFLRDVMLSRPDLHVLYGIRMVRRILNERKRWLRGATLLVTEYQIRQYGGPALAPIQAKPSLLGAFLSGCGCDARLVEKSGVLLRLHPRGQLPPGITYRAVSLADVLHGHEQRIAEAEAQQHHALARVILSADPAVGFDLSAHRPSQFAHVYITGAHFLSLAQLRHLLARLPKGAAKPTVTVFGCPALAPLADATVPDACNVISAVRELAAAPTASLEGLARPVRLETMDLIAEALPYQPPVEHPDDVAPVRISSPSQLFSLCHGHDARAPPLYLSFPVTLHPLPLDELLCYVYLFARFRGQILNTGLATRLRAAFEEMAHVRPLSLEYWTAADFF